MLNLIISFAVPFLLTSAPAQAASSHIDTMLAEFAATARSCSELENAVSSATNKSLEVDKLEGLLNQDSRVAQMGAVLTSSTSLSILRSQLFTEIAKLATDIPFTKVRYNLANLNTQISALPTVTHGTDLETLRRAIPAFRNTFSNVADSVATLLQNCIEHQQSQQANLELLFRQLSAPASSNPAANSAGSSLNPFLPYLNANGAAPFNSVNDPYSGLGAIFDGAQNTATDPAKDAQIRDLQNALEEQRRKNAERDAQIRMLREALDEAENSSDGEDHPAQNSHGDDTPLDMLVKGLLKDTPQDLMDIQVRGTEILRSKKKPATVSRTERRFEQYIQSYLASFIQDIKAPFRNAYGRDSKLIPNVKITVNLVRAVKEKSAFGSKKGYFITLRLAAEVSGGYERLSINSSPTSVSINLRGEPRKLSNGNQHQFFTFVRSFMNTEIQPIMERISKTTVR